MEDAAAAVDEGSAGTKHERRARKALSKLGLKPFDQVRCVTMKKAPNGVFYVDNPEVYKGPQVSGQDVYVVYGRIIVDEGQSLRGMNPNAYGVGGGLPGAAGSGPRAQEADDEEDMPKLATDAAAEAGAGGGHELKEKDIELIIAQAGVSREKAIAALKKNDGDLVNSIMDLTM